MSRPVDFRLEAVEEVDTAYAWYDEQRAGLGEEFFAAFLEQLDLIQENAEGWAVLYRGIRACPMQRFPYVIYYRASPTESTSLPFSTATVLHKRGANVLGSRDSSLTPNDRFQTGRHGS